MTPTLDHLLAPDIDRQWSDGFILALRLRGVPGHLIGEALAEANDHVRVSGRTAHDVFGPADDYARTLSLPPGRTQSRGRLAASVIPSVLGVAGCALVLWTIRATRAGGEHLITMGALVSTAVILCSLIVFGLAASWFLEQAVHANKALIFVACVVWMALVLAPVWFLRDTIGALPLWTGVGAGVLLLLVSSGMYVTVTAIGDPLTPPVPPADGARLGTLTSTRWIRITLALIFPLVTAILGALFLLV
ncbi:MAG: hypothetical protein FWD75_10810 [Propionibacteriaceae bacterium]|nr:hypothetical protein [Propionibacteriaceae bacterium]